MAGRGRSESGFAPRFNPKTTKGEKRKRNVTFWANLNQGSTNEKLDQFVVEQDVNINNSEKEQKEKNSGDRNIEEKNYRSPEAKRKKCEEKEEKENKNQELSWCEEDLNEWDTYIHEYQNPAKAMLKNCVDCNQMYTTEFDNSTKIACHICKANDHGCIQEESGKKSKGYVWLCKECKEILESKDTEIEQQFKVLETNTKDKKESIVKGRSEQKKMATKNKITKVDDKKCPGDQIILSYHDSTIRESDLSTLDGQNWLNDPIISFWFEYLQHVEFDGNTRLLFLNPAITQFIKMGDTKDFPMVLDPLGVKHKEYIFLPVNNNASADKAGGSHWSLLVYSKQDAIWYHFDSQRRSNDKDASQLVARLNMYLNCDTPNSLVDAFCSQQDNNYDCGAFVMKYAQIVAHRAVKGLPIGTCKVNRREANQMRRKVRILVDEFVTETEHNTESPRKDNDIEEKEVIDLSKDHEHIQNMDRRINENPQTKRGKICWYWIKDKCNKGEHCWFKHPKLCETHLKFGECRAEIKPCNNYHTIVCRNNMRRERCEYGNRCRFRHINKEENVDKHRYNERKTNEQIHRNHQYNEHHHVNQLRNANWNQSDNKWKQRNERTYRDNYWNHNKQWNPSARNNEYNPYNQMQGQQRDFYMNQDQNWRNTSYGHQNMNWQSIMEKAAEILAEKMWNNPGKL